MTSLLRFCLFALSFPLLANDHLKPTNVAYQDILSLPTKDADFSLIYGQQPAQFIKVWEGVSPTATKQAAKGSQNNPPTASAKRAVVYVHGGCWLNAFDYSHGKGLYLALAQQGIDTYVIEYRRVGDQGGGWPGSFHDIESALKRLNSYWQHQGVPEYVSLVGHSAGGHLALLAAQEDKVMTNIDKVIGLAAITDVVAYANGNNSCQTATPRFMGGMPKEARQAYKNATPRIALNHSAVEVVLLQGDSDTIVPVQQATDFGAPHTLVEGGGHFDWLHPKTVSFSVFLNEVMYE